MTNRYTIREGTIESGPNMDWNKFYVEKNGVRIAGPFKTRRECRYVIERAPQVG